MGSRTKAVHREFTLTIKRGSHKFTATLSEPGEVSEKRSIKLSEGDRIHVNDGLSRKIPLRDILDYLDEEDAARKEQILNCHQLLPKAAGDYLGEKVLMEFIRLREALGNEGSFLLQIRSDDDGKKLAYSLPWSLLRNRNKYITQQGWTIAMNPANPKQVSEDCVISPTPKILVLAPSYGPEQDTGAESHAKALRERLAKSTSFGGYLKNRSCFKVLRNHDNLITTVKEFEPNIFYYYGHGEKGVLRSISVEEQLSDINASNLADILKEAPDLRLIYLNCCFGSANPSQGTAGSSQSIAAELSNDFPAVIAHRTIAPPDTARAQALEFFGQLLNTSETLDRPRTPHHIIARLYNKVVLPGPQGDIDRIDSLGNRLEWSTPILFKNYETWEPPPITKQSGGNCRKRHIEFDRSDQWDTVVKKANSLLSKDSDHSTSLIIFFGKKNQGMSEFRERLGQHIEKELHAGTHGRPPDVYTIEPELDLNHSPKTQTTTFMKSLSEACGTRSDLTSIVHHMGAQGEPEKAKLFVALPQILDFNSHDRRKIYRLVSEYLTWWGSTISLELSKVNVLALLAIPISTNEPKGPQSLRSKLELALGARFVERLTNASFVILKKFDYLKRSDIDDIVGDNFKVNHRKDFSDAIFNVTQGDFLTVAKIVSETLKGGNLIHSSNITAIQESRRNPRYRLADLVNMICNRARKTRA